MKFTISNEKGSVSIEKESNTFKVKGSFQGVKLEFEAPAVSEKKDNLIYLKEIGEPGI